MDPAANADDGATRGCASGTPEGRSRRETCELPAGESGRCTGQGATRRRAHRRERQRALQAGQPAGRVRWRGWGANGYGETRSPLAGTAPSGGPSRRREDSPPVDQRDANSGKPGAASQSEAGRRCRLGRLRQASTELDGTIDGPRNEKDIRGTPEATVSGVFDFLGLSFSTSSLSAHPADLRIPS